MFFPGVSDHHGHGGRPEASPYDDRHHSLVVLLTFAIFFSFVLLYLLVSVVWASALTACAVVLSFFYLTARRRAVARHAAAANLAGLRLARAWSSSGMEVPAVDVSMIPAFAYKRESGGGGDAAGSGWAQCVICLGIVQVGEVVRQLPACKHLFHERCIDMWLGSHSTCPICRAVVEVAGARSEPPVKSVARTRHLI